MNAYKASTSSLRNPKLFSIGCLIVILLGGLALLTRITTLSMSSPSPPKEWPKVVLFGDSLTQFGFSEEGCWVAKLADTMQRRCDVINRGLSGYTSRNFVALLDSIVTPDLVGDEVAAVTLFLGANDANDPAVNPAQAVPLDEYEANLRSVLKRLVAKYSPEKVLVLPPPPSDGQAWKKAWEERDGIVLSGLPKTNQINRKYYDACLRVAKEMKLAAAEFWDELVDPKMFSDGLHFSKAGAEVVYSYVLKHVDAKVPKNQNLPDWKDLNKVAK